MTKHPEIDALVRFIDGALEPRERLGIATHLARCLACREVETRLRAVVPDGPGKLRLNPVSALLGTLQNWKEAHQESAPPAVRHRVAGELAPFLGQSGAEKLLERVEPDGRNLLSTAESSLRLFLGRYPSARLIDGVVDRAILVSPISSVREVAPESGTQSRTSIAAAIILFITGAYLTAGLLAFALWQVTGDLNWVVDFFRIPGALTLVWLAVVEIWLCLLVIREFSSGDLLLPGWILISCSATCQMLSAVFSQVLGVESPMNPLMLVGGAGWMIQTSRQMGLIIGGTFRFGFLAWGLWYALKAYRHSGFRASLKLLDYVPLAILALYLARNVIDVVCAMQAGKRPDVWEVLGWPVDPLLGLLVAQAMLLLRSVQRMGAGQIGLCWKAFGIGIILTAAGDVSMWAASYGYIPWPWNAISWYIWIPAAAAFALAPSYQLRAMQTASEMRPSH